MYHLVPEKYLPDAITDGVAYYSDGSYSMLRRDDKFFTSRNFGNQGSYVQGHTLVSKDAADETSPPLSGLRTLRNIRVTGRTDAYIERLQATSNIYVYTVEAALIVFRQGIATPIDKDILDSHLHNVTAPIDGTVSFYQDEEEWTLCYPGVVKLHSGDFLQLQILYTNVLNGQPSSNLICSISYDCMYDIKYN